MNMTHLPISLADGISRKNIDIDSTAVHRIRYTSIDNNTIVIDLGIYGTKYLNLIQVLKRQTSRTQYKDPKINSVKTQIKTNLGAHFVGTYWL